MLLITELKLDLNDDISKLEQLISKRLHIKDIPFTYEIHRKSIDSRKDIIFSYQVLVTIENEDKYLSHKGVTKYNKTNLKPKKVVTNKKPIIIGYGPAGIFASYRFIEAGIKPIIIEKGKRIKEREKDVERFFNDGILNPKSNIQFGEGGAGTFSDAKLTTRIKNPFIEYILDVFVKHGADPSIKYEAHPHIGTDEIRKIIERITNYMISCGADFHFEEEVKEFIITSNKLEKIVTDKNEYSSDYYLLGVGHSAYPAIKSLFDNGVHIEPKDISIGFRVEHPQSLIDDNQYHGIKSNKLEHSEYFLTHNDIRGVYSFCMCPGGIVVPATSEENRIVTNGMSYASRDSGIANSAILVQVKKEEYANHPLAGFDYLKQIEEKAYNISSSYKALSQNIKDFIEDKEDELIFKSTYPLNTVNYNFNHFFNNVQCECLKRAFIEFDKKIPGFINSGILVGPETRSSCPIRILRNESYESVNTSNLYPIGEGAGYGGGIISCALDGIKVSDFIINNIK